jgi:hypothetical protein
MGSHLSVLNCFRDIVCVADGFRRWLMVSGGGIALLGTQGFSMVWIYLKTKVAAIQESLWRGLANTLPGFSEYPIANSGKQIVASEL